MTLLPEIIVCLTALGVIALDLLLDQRSQRTGRLAFLTGLGLSIALAVLVGFKLGGFLGQSLPVGTFHPDLMAFFFRALLLTSALLTVLFSVRYVEDKLRHPGEFYALLVLATLGAMLMTCATEIISLYLALELLSISSFVLVALRKDQPRSAEGAIKYLIYGAVSSALLLYGFSLLFGITGSLEYTAINSFLQQQGDQFLYQNGNLKLELTLALLMVLAGMGYKIAAVPFHMWAPDVYEGAPLPVTAFLSASSKVAGFAALLRLLEALNVTNLVPVWSVMIAVMAVLSMTYGNLVAIAQPNIKRLFAYSSMAHAGYLLMGVLAMSQTASRETALIGVLYYLLVYVFMNLGAFAVISYFAARSRSSRLQDWAGLGRVHPVYGLVLGCCLLSLTGLPPFAGFTGKFYLFGAVTQMGSAYLWLVVVGVLNSVLSLYYYARILRVLFFGQPGRFEEDPTPQPALAFASVICVGALVGLFVFPNWVINLVSQINTLI
ncbi:MAG: NADH-quinone oxidoreductase subunit N [Candidatus Sericytochromatia bacterium]